MLPCLIIATCFTIAKIKNKPRCSINLCNGKLFSHKENETLSFVAGWMELADVILNEMSATERQMPRIFTCMCKLKMLTSQKQQK